MYLLKVSSNTIELAVHTSCYSLLTYSMLSVFRSPLYWTSPSIGSSLYLLELPNCMSWCLAWGPLHRWLNIFLQTTAEEGWDHRADWKRRIRSKKLTRFINELKTLFIIKHVSLHVWICNFSKKDSNFLSFRPTPWERDSKFYPKRVFFFFFFGPHPKRVIQIGWRALYLLTGLV